MANFSIFYNNQKNHRVELSSTEAIYQCMDLAYEWVFINNIPKVAIQQAIAKDVYLKPNDVTRKYFDLIKNTPDFIPKTGDLVVFNGPTKAGHIAIATGEGDLLKFKSFDQNWGLDLRPRIVTHNYDNPKLLGVLRIKD